MWVLTTCKMVLFPLLAALPATSLLTLGRGLRKFGANSSQTRRFATAITPANFLLENAVMPSWYLLEGPVKSGYGRGSKTLGFPTANLPQFEDFIDKNNLKNGVYSGLALIEGGDSLLGCVSNIGVSPTFVGQENPCRIIETYIYDRENGLPDFYGKQLRLVLTGYIRPELKYSNLQDLISQIEYDVEIAKLFNEKLLRGDLPSIDAERVKKLHQVSSAPIEATTASSDHIVSKVYNW